MGDIVDVEGLPQLALELGFEDGTIDLPATKLPSLNTTDRTYSKTIQSKGLFSNNGTNFVPQSKVTLSQHPVISGVSKILEGFSRFIASLTEQNDVGFTLYFTSQSRRQEAIIHARLLNSYAPKKEVVLKMFNGEVNHELLDFSIEFVSLAGQEPLAEIESVKKPFSFSILPVDAEFSELILSYDREVIPDIAASHLLKAAASYNQPSDAECFLGSKISDLSIMNFPCASRPIPLPQDQLAGFTSTKAAPALLHSAFERRAAEFPHRVAIDYLGYADGAVFRRRMTYAEVNLRASQVAKNLRLISQLFVWQVGAPKFVPVFLPSSPELFVSYLGILKAGMSFVPLPLDAPSQRLQDIFEDLGAPIVLGLGEEPAKGPWHRDDAEHAGGVTWINVATIQQELKSVPSTSSNLLGLGIEPSEEELAYVLYTSGSTGKPKGVQITHLSATCSISSNASSLPIGGTGKPWRWFQFASPTFDPSLLEIFLTLSSGGTVCAAERQLMLTDLEGTLTELEATVTLNVPSMAMLMRPSRLPTLETLICMGENLNRRVVEKFAPGGLVNGYGPTEASINCTIYPSFKVGDRGSIIGQALPTTSLFILDPESYIPQAIPLGMIGELAIGGPQVSIGYLKRPKETAEAFVTSPDFGRLYRTGDKARIVWDNCGQQTIEFLGRINDGQVKLNGRRVELGEIESVLAEAEEVMEVVNVVCETTGIKKKYLVACIVPSVLEAEESQKEMIEYNCRRIAELHLPEYMRPRKYIFMQTLPRSTTGKVDRGTLSRTTAEAIESQLAELMDDTPTLDDPSGTGLLGMVIQLLKRTTDERANINPSTSLLDIGIDSLKAIEFLQKARDVNINELTIVDVLRRVTPDILVGIIIARRQEQVDAGDKSPSKLPMGPGLSTVELATRLRGFHERCIQQCSEKLLIPKQHIEAVLPTTGPQARMVASFLRTSKDPFDSQKTYIEHSLFQIPSKMAVNRFRESVATVLNRHQCFRMAYNAVMDPLAPFAQCILSPACAESKIPWAEIHCDSENEVLFNQSVKHAQITAAESINLRRPPLVVSLIRSETRNVLVLSLFHGLFDGASLKLLQEEVVADYYGRQQPPRTSIEKAVETHYKADWKAVMQYWMKMFIGVKPYRFRPDADVDQAAARKLTKSLAIASRMSFEQLTRRARSIETTALSVLQAAWALILAQNQAADGKSFDVIFGSVCSGRFDRDSQLCMGSQFLSHAMRLENSVGEPENDVLSNRTVCGRLGTQNVEAIPFLQVPCPTMLAATEPIIFDTQLALQTFGPSIVDGDMGKVLEPFAEMAVDFSVMMEIWPAGDLPMNLKVIYKDTHLTEAAAQLTLERMDSHIDYILSNPDAKFDHRRI